MKELYQTVGYNPLKKDTKGFTGHKGQIMALLPITSQSIYIYIYIYILIDILVSSCMKGMICEWNLEDLEPRGNLKGHTMGVYSLDWSEKIASLFSAGIDHDIFIWNPFVPTRIFVLKGHNHSLVGIKCVPNTYQLVSADISGMFRIWHIKNFNTVQTFNCSMNEINCFIVTTNPKRVIAGGKRLHFFDYDEPTDHHLADDQACIWICYNSVFYTFITAHPKCIKVWSAVTGELISVFRELTTREITCICMDNRQRKVFVGDQKGRVFSINIKNGARMKKFKRHKEDSSCLFYWEKGNRLMSCSWDGIINVHDDSTADQKGLCRSEFKQHKKAINFLDFDRHQTLLASCSDDETIILTNLTSYRLEAVLTGSKEQVKVGIFLGESAIFCSADLTGRLYFWAVLPSKIKNQLLTTKTDPIESEVGTTENFPIRSMSFDAEASILYTGDEMGHIQKWDVAPLIQKVRKIGFKDASSKISAEFDPNHELGTFLTETNTGAPPDEHDVILLKRVKGHEDRVTSVCFVPDPPCLATCAFDCKAYIWNYELERIGSLKIGNMSNNPNWLLKVDKSARMAQDRKSAFDLIDELESQDYDVAFRGKTAEHKESKKIKQDKGIIYTIYIYIDFGEIYKKERQKELEEKAEGSGMRQLSTPEKDKRYISTVEEDDDYIRAEVYIYIYIYIWIGPGSSEAK